MEKQHKMLFLMTQYFLDPDKKYYACVYHAELDTLYQDFNISKITANAIDRRFRLPWKWQENYPHPDRKVNRMKKQ